MMPTTPIAESAYNPRKWETELLVPNSSQKFRETANEAFSDMNTCLNLMTYNSDINDSHSAVDGGYIGYCLNYAANHAEACINFTNERVDALENNRTTFLASIGNTGWPSSPDPTTSLYNSTFTVTAPETCNLDVNIRVTATPNFDGLTLSEINNVQMSWNHVKMISCGVPSDNQITVYADQIPSCAYNIRLERFI